MCEVSPKGEGAPGVVSKQLRGLLIPSLLTCGQTGGHWVLFLSEAWARLLDTAIN